MHTERSMTPKDRMYLSDLLNLTLVNAKKAHLYCEMAAEDDVKKKIKSIEGIFVQSYDGLLELLEDGKNEQKD